MSYHYGRNLVFVLSYGNTFVSFSALERRQEAVTCLMTEDIFVISKIRQLLPKLPDLEKGLCTIFHKKVGKINISVLLKSSLYGP